MKSSTMRYVIITTSHKQYNNSKLVSAVIAVNSSKRDLKAIQ